MGLEHLTVNRNSCILERTALLGNQRSGESTLGLHDSPLQRQSVMWTINVGDENIFWVCSIATEKKMWFTQRNLTLSLDSY